MFNISIKKITLKIELRNKCIRKKICLTQKKHLSYIYLKFQRLQYFYHI